MGGILFFTFLKCCRSNIIILCQYILATKDSGEMMVMRVLKSKNIIMQN